MWKGPDLVMRAVTQTMGESLTLETGGQTLIVRGIFELVSNPDETIGVADIENFKAMADFRKTDLPFAPRIKDRVTVPSLLQSFIIFDVRDDYFGRYRCFLMDE